MSNGGYPDQLLTLWQDQHFLLVTSDFQRDELARALGYKKIQPYVSKQEIVRLNQWIDDFAVVVEPTPGITLSPDGTFFFRKLFRCNMCKCKKIKLLSIWQMVIAIGAPFVILAGLSSLAFSQSKALKKKVRVTASTRLDWTFAATRRSLATPPVDLVGRNYNSREQSYQFYRPENPHTDQTELPLILYLSHKDQAEGWQHWKKVCKSNNICFAAPHNAGADQPFAKRVRIILDVLDDARRRHRIDRYWS